MTAIAVLSAGIIIPRILSRRLSPVEQSSYDNIKTGSRKFFLLSLAPLVVMAIALLRDTDSPALFIYQIPAASVVIDVFCIIRVRKIISSRNKMREFRFVFIPFVSLALTKLLFFLAFFIEMKEIAQRSSFAYL